MKLLKLIAVFILIPFTPFCQQFSGIVKYKDYRHNVYKQSTLFFKKSESLYMVKKENISKDKLTTDANEDKNSFNLNINIQYDEPEGTALYTDNTQKIIIDKLFLAKDLKSKTFDSLFIKEKTGLIKWEIKKDVKLINSYKCQKAECQFRGRKYTAWFSNDIPVGFGPWKLNGLPGLIFSVKDESNSFSFEIESIEFTDNFKIDKTLFDSNNYISPVTYREKLRLLLEDIYKEISAKIKSGLPRGVVSRTNKTSGTLVGFKNSIELNFDDINNL